MSSDFAAVEGPGSAAFASTADQPIADRDLKKIAVALGKILVALNELTGGNKQDQQVMLAALCSLVAAKTGGGETGGPDVALKSEPAAQQSPVLEAG
jgi:hypothetical protein